jgi:hypothetical protein
VSYAIVITLLFFSAIGSAGAGVAYAVGRARELTEWEIDVGMRAVTLLLFCFGAACSFVAVGLTGVFAFGGIIAWYSYVLAAHRLGVFRIVDRQPDAELASERRRIA